MGDWHSIHRHVGVSRRLRSTLALGGLLVAAYVGNLTRWTLFFDIQFIFGAIAIWLVVGLYGWRWGVVAGIVSAISSYSIWYNPVSVLVFILEAGLVGWGFYYFPSRTQRNLVLLDGLFWVFIGIPLTWGLYTLLLEIDPSQTHIILMKQPLNSIFNALVASLLLIHLPLYRWLGRSRFLHILSFQQTLFNLLVAFILFPSLGLLIFSSYGVVAHVQREANADLDQVAIETVVSIRNWYQQRLNTNYALARTLENFANVEDVPLSTLQSYLDFTENLYPDLTGVALLNAQGKPLVSSRNWSHHSYWEQPNHPAFQMARMILEPVAIQPTWEAETPPQLGLVLPIVQGVTVQGFVVNELNLDQISYLLKANPDAVRLSLTIVERDRIILASTRPDRLLGQALTQYQTGDRVAIGPHTDQWFPPKGSQVAMVRWMNSKFIQEHPLVPGLSWTLIAEKSAAPDARLIQRTYAQHLAIVFGITVLALLLSIMVSQRLVLPLAQLATATTNLPTRLALREPITWFDSRVTEFASLWSNFQKMATTLAQQFQDIQQALDYEARIQRMTARVRDSLDEGTLLQTAVEELGQGLGTIGCDVTIYADDPTSLQGRRGANATLSYEYPPTQPNALGASLPLSDRLPAIDATLAQGGPCQFSLIVPHPWRPQWSQASILACPIRDDQIPLGDLWLYKPSPQVFTTADIRLVQQVANQCAIAMRQARLYQAAQAQVEALAALNQLKDDFLSTVSHELRTPITNIKLAIRMLKISLQEPQRGSPAETLRDRYLSILQAECDREAHLINDLLDLQRLTAGTQPLNLEPIDLQAWLLDLSTTFRERAQARQQQFQLDLPPTLPIILSDVDCLERILSELLNNACKYTPPGEQIGLSVWLQADDYPTPCLTLKVVNSGVEIPAEAQTHVFDKFYRVQHLDRWNQGGTGLGLALVQQLTAHLGGTIQLTSQANHTCFIVQLPLTAPPGGTPG